MDLILEFIFDLVLESSMEIAKDKKIKKWITKIFFPSERSSSSMEKKVTLSLGGAMVLFLYCAC